MATFDRKKLEFLITGHCLSLLFILWCFCCFIVYTP